MQLEENDDVVRADNKLKHVEFMFFYCRSAERPLALVLISHIDVDIAVDVAF